MSFPVTNHIIIRISETETGASLDFRHQASGIRHQAFGLIEPDHVEGMTEGWAEYLGMIKSDCE